MIKKILLLPRFIVTATIINFAAHATGQLPPIAAIATPPQPDAIQLYPGASPGSASEQWETFAGQRIVRNVGSPTLTPFLPEPSKATGAAVIIAPGGAFLMLSMDSEGYAVAHWLAEHGIAAFVLKYRLRESERDPNVYLASLVKLMQGIPDKDRAVPGTPASSLEDAKAAVRMIRSRAGEWKVNSSRVGFLGFSAGAMLTLSIGTDPDHAVRPDFIAPIYGPLGAMTVPADAPPMFAAIAGDDPLFGKSGFELITQWRDAHRPVEFHVFEKGGHGFGMNHQGTTSDMWIDEFYAWMKDRGLL